MDVAQIYSTFNPILPPFPPELLGCVEAMVELGQTPSFETLRDRIIPSLSLSQPRLTLQMLQNAGLSASATATPLLAVLVKNNMMEHAVSFGEGRPGVMGS